MKYYYYEGGKKITVKPQPVGPLEVGTVVHDLTSRVLYQIKKIYKNPSGEEMAVLRGEGGMFKFCKLSALKEEISLGIVVIRKTPEEKAKTQWQKKTKKNSENY